MYEFKINCFNLPILGWTKPIKTAWLRHCAVKVLVLLLSLFGGELIAFISFSIKKESWLHLLDWILSRYSQTVCETFALC